LAFLEIKFFFFEQKEAYEIVKGVDLAVDQNEIHAIMGPNGSGKSTLAYAMMGHPAYEITDGEILFDGTDLVELGADERAQLGLFLAFQYPHAVPGVTVASFLRAAVNAQRKAANGGEDDPVKIPEFRKELTAAMERLKVPKEMTSRYLNQGFSGATATSLRLKDSCACECTTTATGCITLGVESATVSRSLNFALAVGAKTRMSARSSAAN